MANVRADTAIHMARVAVAATLTAVEKKAFPMTYYRCIKACILHFPGVANFGDYAEAGSK